MTLEQYLAQKLQDDSHLFEKEPASSFSLEKYAVEKNNTNTKQK